MLSHLKQASYEALMQDTFQLVQDDSRSVELRLVKVEGLPAPSSQYDSFSIEFLGPRDSFLQQQSYALTHEKMGTFTLLLVAVEEVEDGYLYQAVFNVVKDKDDNS